MPDLDWTTIIVALVTVTSLGTRLIAWLRAHRRFIRILCESLERLSGVGAGAKEVVFEAKRETKAAGGELLALADTFAAGAERKQASATSSATERQKHTRAKRALRGLARWAPFLGVLF